MQPDHFAGIQLEQYFRSVKATRERSYAQLLSQVKQVVPNGSWLDVGCSYGWLLHAISQHGFQGEGIEPSHAAAEHARQAGLTIHTGLFPQDLASDQRYNVISFMDVLEHLEEPHTALLEAKRRLLPHGALVIQVPDQACFLYRLAEWMHRSTSGKLGFAWRRLWLLDFDFPHRTYFNRTALTRLLELAGWEVRACWRSPLGDPVQAFDRVSYARQAGFSLLTNSIVACGVASIQLADLACGHGGLITVIAQAKMPEGEVCPP
jgi:2-polyprenyl-3-methyl-5-hydroxy-6-metoxy-1,4-benzoquinol methylase